MVNNLRVGSFDAITPTFYFGITQEGDTALDDLGAAATTSDIAFYARQGMEEARVWLQTQKAELADPLGLPLVFYEGGQHLTGDPFGEEPSYAQALLDIQRDTAMYNLYTEWFDFLRTLQEGDQPISLMNFSFVAGRSARYGSWGILETMNQDTSAIPAPKYSAILDAINACNPTVSLDDLIDLNSKYSIFPNPTSNTLNISGPSQNASLAIFDSFGRLVVRDKYYGESWVVDVKGLEGGNYILQIKAGTGTEYQQFVIIE